MTIVQQMEQRALEKERKLGEILDRPVISSEEISQKMLSIVSEVLTGLGDLSPSLYSYITLEVEKIEDKRFVAIIIEDVEHRKEIVSKLMEIQTSGLNINYGELEKMAKCEGLEFCLLPETEAFYIAAKFN